MLLAIALELGVVACGSTDARRNGPPDGYVQQSLDGHTLTLPQGFKIAVWTEQVPGVRLMALGPDGDVYATLTESGRVVRLPDRDHDGVADSVLPVAEGLNLPHGLAFRGDTLYVAENHRVVRFDRPGAKPTVVVPNLPSAGGHFTRTILLQGDHLLVSVGSSCNICDEQDRRRAAVVRYDLDGSRETLFATGLRNAVGLALHPLTGDIWASNNDRDNLGDDLPPDRVNVLREGGFYGWPFCYLPNQPNPEYQRTAGPCAEAIGPAVTLPAHTAPLGLAFYTGQMFPPEYRGDLFVALHGSWNRSVPIGYGVVRVHLEQGRPAGAPKTFVSGWREGNADALAPAGGRVWGRPVDVLVLPDGSLLISDDEGGRIYRVTSGGGLEGPDGPPGDTGELSFCGPCGACGPSALSGPTGEA
jgi:glucose/arabinose dehydrogenase